MKRFQVNVAMPLFLAVAAVLSGSRAWAVTQPSDTTAFLYPVYDLIVNKIGAGPAMFAAGFIGICVAAYFLHHHQLGRVIGSLVATGLMLAAASIVPTLGAIF